ncbi:oligosaccharide flippase family protein [Candidatus Parcubacteria bacterium]|nr:oligosaccharide flippase family protein [Candidatus Parcubacteria bacterium]
MEAIKSKLYKLLRRSEGFFKTDMVYLARGGFWLSGAQFGSALIGLLLSIAFANLLPAETYGTYKYVLSLMGIVGALTLSGLPVAITRAVAKGFEGELLRSFWLNLKWNILICFTCILGSWYYFAHGNETLGIGLILIGVFFPIIDSGELYNAFLNGRSDFRSGSLLRLLRQLIIALGLFATLLITKDPVWIIASYFILHTCTVVSMFVYVLRTQRPNTATDVHTPRLAVHTSVVNSISIFTDQLDNILVFHALGAGPLAVYNFAQAIPEQLAGFIKNIGLLATPKFSQGDKDTIVSSLWQKSMKVFLFGLIMSVAYIFLSPFIFKALFPQYLTSIKLSQVYSLILIFSAALPLALLDANVKIKEKYALNIFGNIAKIVCLLGGFALFGLWGVIVGKVVGKAIAVCLAFFLTLRI